MPALTRRKHGSHARINEGNTSVKDILGMRVLVPEIQQKYILYVERTWFVVLAEVGALLHKDLNCRY